MPDTAEEILAAAMNLPPEVRALIAERLLMSVEPENEEIWRCEIERREKEIEEGKARLHPHEQVISRMEERLRSNGGT